MVIRRRVPTHKVDGRGRQAKGNPLVRRPPPVRRVITLPPKSKLDPEAVAQRKEIFLQAYTESMCNITLACQNCKISSSSVYSWRGTDPAFLKKMEALMEVRIDFYENALDKNARAGNVAAQIFFLKCRAKGRGYVERTEIGGPDGGPVRLAVSRDELPDPALRSALKRMMEEDPEFARKLLEQGSESEVDDANNV